MHYPPTQIAESGVKNFFSDDGSGDAAPEVRAAGSRETSFLSAPQVGFGAGEPPEEISMSV